MHNFIGIKNKTNNFRKGFFTDPYDEPTFLTFAIDFNFEGIPTSLVDNHLWQSPLFGESKDSAINFLINRQYADKANNLKVFKETLSYLTFNAPWYFQSITGLRDLWQKGTNIEAAQKGMEAVIEIETLEAVDLRINRLADLYRNAVYDKQFMRERVPDNLQWFSMDIYVAEARNMRFRLPGVTQQAANVLGVNTADLGNIVGGGNILSNVLQSYGYVKFKCRQCTFDFSETFAGGRDISVDTVKDQETNLFKINVGYFEEESKYADGTKLYDNLLKSSINNPWSGARNIGALATNAASFLSGLPVIGDDIANAGGQVMNALGSIGSFVNPALGAASAFLEPPVTDLGKLY